MTNRVRNRFVSTIPDRTAHKRLKTASTAAIFSEVYDRLHAAEQQNAVRHAVLFDRVREQTAFAVGQPRFSAECVCR